MVTQTPQPKTYNLRIVRKKGRGSCYCKVVLKNKGTRPNKYGVQKRRGRPSPPWPRRNQARAVTGQRRGTSGARFNLANQ